MITIELNTRNFERVIRAARTEVVQKSIVRSINRTVEGMQTWADDYVRNKEGLNLKKKEVTSRILPRKIRTFTEYGEVRISAAAVPLILYASAARRRVRVRIKGTSKEVKNAFFMQRNNGQDGIFQRRDKSRLPVDELFSTSVRDVFKDDSLVGELQAEASRRFDNEFKNNFNFYLSRV